MRNKILLVGLLAGATLWGAAVADDAKDQAAIAKQLPSAKVTLSQGLTASRQRTFRIRLPDSFLKAFNAHDTDSDAAVKIVGSIKRNNNDDGGAR